MRHDTPSAITLNALPREGLIFLAQRLEELTSSSSLDSFRAPTVNCPTLLTEGADQIESILAANGGVSASSADPIVEELTHRIGGNDVFYAIVPRDRKVIERIRGETGATLRSTLQELAQEVSAWGYATQIMSMLIERLNDKDKHLTDFLATELVTTLVNSGMSRRHIHEAVCGFFWDPERAVSKADDLRPLFKEVFPHYHDFEVCFSVSDNIKVLSNDHFSGLNIRITSEIPAKFAQHASDIRKPDAASGWFLTVSKISALDRHTAVAIARKRASLLTNLFRMFNHATEFRVSDVVAVEQCCEDSVRLIGPESYVKRSVSDSSDRFASRRLTHLLTNSRYLRGKHYDKFVSVCDFHGLSIDSDSLENKLINLWISLETICPSVRGLSKVDSVVKGVLPCITLKYVDRLFAAASNDVTNWSRGKAGPILDKVSGVGPSKKAKLLAMCTQQKHQALLAELLGSFDENHLLRNRIFKLYSIFSDTASALSALEQHRIRVGWQIKRIYRARNHIVHLGQVPAFIGALVDSAHDYFDQVLATIGDISCGPNGFSNFNTSFSYLEWEYKTYLDRLKSLDLEDDGCVGMLLWSRKPAVPRAHVI